MVEIIIDVAHLSDEQLRHEVTFWRQNAAATLWSQRVTAKAAEKAGDFKRAIEIDVGILQPQLAALTEALAGQYHEACEACGEPLLEGQPVYRNRDGGDIHAPCMGEVTSAEGFFGPDDEPLTADDPVPQPHPHSTGFPPDEILAEAKRTRAWLRRAPSRRHQHRRRPAPPSDDPLAGIEQELREIMSPKAQELADRLDAANKAFAAKLAAADAQDEADLAGLEAHVVSVEAGVAALPDATPAV